MMAVWTLWYNPYARLYHVDCTRNEALNKTFGQFFEAMHYLMATSIHGDFISVGALR